VSDGGGTSPNPYAPPLAAPEPAVPREGDAPTREELEAFVGKKASYYWRKSARNRHDDGLMAGWNWAAAFLSIFWLLYRRMHKEFWITMGILVMWGAAEGVLEEAAQLAPEVARSIERFGNFVFAVVMGMIGNGLYLRRVRREVLQSRQLFSADPQGHRAHLAKRGGTSWIAALIGVAVLACVAVLAAMLEDGERLG
jgi:hypothetical protein